MRQLSVISQEDVQLNKDLENYLEEKAQKGDVTAFNALLGMYRVSLIKLAYQYTRHYEDAEDAVQVSYMKASKAFDTFRGDSRIYTWVYRIIINTCKNLLVSQKRKPTYSLDTPNQDDMFDGGESSGNTWDNILVSNNDPANMVQEELYREVLTRRLNEIPEERRITFVLREVEGLSYQEISDKQGVPIGTVRSRLHRARIELNEVIND